MIAVFAPDLMDRSKIAAAAPDATFVRNASELIGATAAVVDLSRPGVVEALDAIRASGASVVAFGSHVDRDLLDAARAKGCVVLARSAFFADVAGALAKLGA